MKAKVPQWQLNTPNVYVFSVEGWLHLKHHNAELIGQICCEGHRDIVEYFRDALVNLLNSNGSKILSIYQSIRVLKLQ
jgi:hypothetical protein